MNPCPTEPCLKAFLTERLSPPECENLEQHLAACPRCQRRLQELTNEPVPERWRELLTRISVNADASEPACLVHLANVSVDQIVNNSATVTTGASISVAAGPTPSSDERRRGEESPPAFPVVPGYEVLGELGRGGMGVVYKARQMGPNRLVALKMLRVGDGPRSNASARFYREAEAAGRLRHANLVQVYEVGSYIGLPFISLEYAEGGSLAEHLAGVPLPIAPAAALVETLARAMHHAHQRGIVHRDLKPANILLQGSFTAEDAEERREKALFGFPLRSSASSAVSGFIPKITDFGLAKLLDEEVRLTRTGLVLGTPAYMAPEQVLPGKQPVGPAADVYALGAILYELLCGRPPFVGETPLDTAEQVVHAEPVSPRRLNAKIPRDAETIILKCLAKEPAHRYASAQALAADLRRCVNNEPIQARPVGQVERLWRWSKRNPVIAGLSAAVLLLLFLVAGVGSFGYVREARLRAQAERRYYAASMGLVQEAWESHNILHFQDLLNETAAFPERGFEWYYWQRLCRVEHLRLVGHRGGLNAVAFAPDGQRLVTGGNDGTARVWDATSGQELFCLQAHRSQVTAVAFAPDGRWLVTGSTDGTARVWDTAGWRELRTLEGQKSGPVWAVAVIPDGKRVIAGNEDGTATVWDVASGQELLTLQGPMPLPVLGASMVGLLSSPYQRAFLAGSALYPRRTGHTGPVLAVAATGDGRRVVTGSQDQTARIWDADNGRQLLPPLHHPAEVTSVAVSGDGRRIAAADCARGKLWDASSGREIRSFDGILSVTLTPDGTRVVTGSADGLVKVWDTATGRKMATLKGHNTNSWASCR